MRGELSANSAIVTEDRDWARDGVLGAVVEVVGVVGVVGVETLTVPPDVDPAGDVEETAPNEITVTTLLLLALCT